MDRAILANHVALAELDRASDFWIESQILGRRPDDRAVSDNIPRAHSYRSFNDDVRLDVAPFPDDSAGADHRIRTDLDVVADLRTGVDERGGMNLHKIARLLETEIGRAPVRRRADDDVIEQFDLKQFRRLGQTSCQAMVGLAGRRIARRDGCARR